MSVIVRPARPGDEVQCQKVMNDVKNLKWLGGFTMLEELNARVRKQEESGMVTLMVLERDGEVVGTSEIGPGQHYTKMGLVAVDPRYRDFDPTSPAEKRLGYGSAMYASHAMRAALEGKLFLLDQTHWLNQTMELYLAKINFEPAEVELRQRARNFCSLKFWRWPLAERNLDDWIELMNKRSDGGIEFEIPDSPKYEEVFKKQVDDLEKFGKGDLIPQLCANRAQALQRLRRGR